MPILLKHDGTRPNRRRIVARCQVAQHVKILSRRGRPVVSTAGEIRSFHAFKWRLAMAIVAEAADPNIRVETIRDVFIREFPDRAMLAETTGWRAEPRCNGSLGSP